MNNQQTIIRLLACLNVRGRLKRGGDIGWLVECKALIAIRPTDQPHHRLSPFPVGLLLPYTHTKNIFLTNEKKRIKKSHQA